MAGADEAEGGGEVMEDGEEEGVERGSEGEQGVLGRLGVGEGRGGYDAIPDGFGGPRQRNFSGWSGWPARKVTAGFACRKEQPSSNGSGAIRCAAA